MVNVSDEPPLSSSLTSWAKNSVSPSESLDPNHNPSSQPTQEIANEEKLHNVRNAEAAATTAGTSDRIASHNDTKQQDTPVVDKKGNGKESTTINKSEPKQSLGRRFLRDVKRIIFSSWINWLLVFVPVALILGALEDWAGVDGISPTLVFALNAVAIIPLASLLSFATESVAVKLGDTVGALLNVTFGNAVELIIFIIALVAKEVRVVQAAALGSILSNLLVILGMCFVVGGLRFREQVSPEFILAERQF